MDNARKQVTKKELKDAITRVLDFKIGKEERRNYWRGERHMGASLIAFVIVEELMSNGWAFERPIRVCEPHSFPGRTLS